MKAYKIFIILFVLMLIAVHTGRAVAMPIVDPVRPRCPSLYPDGISYLASSNAVTLQTDDAWEYRHQRCKILPPWPMMWIWAFSSEVFSLRKERNWRWKMNQLDLILLALLVAICHIIVLAIIYLVALKDGPSPTDQSTNSDWPASNLAQTDKPEPMPYSGEWHSPYYRPYISGYLGKH
jgi:hypothetical protein